MTTLQRAAAGRRQTFFEQDGMDQLVSMVLELATELWTVRQRLYVLERAVEGQSAPLSDLVETYQPSATEQAELEAMRAKMVRELFRALGQAPSGDKDADAG